MRRGQLKGISSDAWVKEQGSTGEKLGSEGSIIPVKGVCPQRDRMASTKLGDFVMEGKSVNPVVAAKRRVFARLSIAAGNALQIGGILAACFALSVAGSTHSTPIAVVAMLIAWVLLYLSVHAIAHWLIGRIVGIRFLHYTVGGTGNPEGWPPGIRWIFEHLPFFGMQTDKLSMQNASPQAKAAMWSAGVTSSAIFPAFGVFWAWYSGVPFSRLFFLFALFWSFGTLTSNWRSRTGDYAKAKRALGRE